MRSILGALVLVVVATACTAEAGSETTPEPRAAGPVEVAVGKPATYKDAQVLIKAVTVDPQCVEFAPEPKGHVVALEVEITTGADQAAADSVSLLVNPLQMQVEGSDGARRDVGMAMCGESGQSLNPDMTAGQKYAGRVEVEVPEPKGRLVLSDMGDTEWELAYG